MTLVQTIILKYLKEEERACWFDFWKEYKIPRATLWDNMRALEKQGKVIKMPEHDNRVGRPTTFWRLANNGED